MSKRNNKHSRAGSTCAECARCTPYDAWRWGTATETISEDGQVLTVTRRRHELPEAAGKGECYMATVERSPWDWRQVGLADPACSYFLRKREEA